MNRSQRLLLSLATVLVAVLMSASGFAACSGPTGLAGQQVYASNLGLMVFCDGTNWVSMASGGASGAGGASTPGGTTKDVQFNTSGSLDADTGYFGFDKTNHRLGVGTVTPTMTLHVSGTFVVSNSTSPTTPPFMVGSTGYASILSTSTAYGGFPSALFINRPVNVWGPVIAADPGSQSDLLLINSNSTANRRAFQFVNVSDKFTMRGLTDAGSIAATFFSMDPALAVVGVSNTSPIATLDVGGNISSSGVVQVSGSSLTCASSINGAVRWSSTSNTVQVCSSAGWVSLVSGSGNPNAAGATTQVQYNNNGAFGADANFTYTSSSGLVSVTAISATNISGTAIQLGGGGTCSTAGHGGKIRYSGSQVEYCNGSAWSQLASSAGTSGSVVFARDWQSLATGIVYNGTTGTSNYTLPTTPPSNTWAIIITVQYIHGGTTDHGYWSFYAYQNGYNTSPNKAVYQGQYYNKYYMSDQRDIIVPWHGGSSPVLNIETTYSYNTNPLNYYNVLYSGYIAASASNDNLGNHTATQTLDMSGFGIQNVGVITGTTVSTTNHYGQYASYTTIYNPGSLSGNAIAANTVSTTYTSTSMVQLMPTSLACTSSVSGSVRFNATSNTAQVCAGSSGWVSLVSSTSNFGISGTLTVSSTNQTSNNPSLFVSSAGKVGIGTNSPAESLDLNGGNIKMGYENLSCAPGVCSYSGGTAYLNCSAGKQIVGGGCDCQDNVNMLRGSRPNGTTGWACVCGASGSGQASAAVWATCANIK